MVSHHGYRHPSKQCLEYGTPATRILYGSSREYDSPAETAVHYKRILRPGPYLCLVIIITQRLHNL